MKFMFLCGCCNNQWSSVKGTAEFKLWQDQKQLHICAVKYHQQCRNCDDWSSPDYDFDQLSDIIDNVIFKYFDTNKRVTEHKPTSNPTANHRTDLCEACALGVCTINRPQTGHYQYQSDEDDPSDEEHHNYPSRNKQPPSEVQNVASSPAVKPAASSGFWATPKPVDSNAQSSCWCTII